MAYYVPGTAEKDVSKVIMSLQQVHERAAATIADTATNTAAIATNAADIATLSSTKAAGAASSTDNAAARFDGTGGKTLQDSPLIVADTTGALSRNGGGGIPLQGTNTNDSAASGDVGEHISDTGSVSLTSTVVSNICDITLPAGEWDISGYMRYSTAGATTTTDVISAIAVANNVVTGGSVIGLYAHTRVASTADLATTHSFTPLQVSLAGSQTYYLNCRATFATSTAASDAILRARRVR